MKCNITHKLSGIVLYMRPANGRRRYNVTSSFTGWRDTQNETWIIIQHLCIYKDSFQLIQQ